METAIALFQSVETAEGPGASVVAMEITDLQFQEK